MNELIANRIGQIKRMSSLLVSFLIDILSHKWMKEFGEQLQCAKEITVVDGTNCLTMYPETLSFALNGGGVLCYTVYNRAPIITLCLLLSNKCSTNTIPRFAARMNRT